MTRTTIALSALFAAQIALAAGLTFTAGGDGAFEAREPLAASEPLDAAVRLVIADADDAVELERADEGWRLPALGGFPADAGKVDRLVTTLKDLKRGWPVAENRASAKRFKTSEDSFERRIDFIAADDKRTTILIGDAPAFKQAYVRNAADANVYAAAFSAYDAPASLDDWIDRKALSLDANAVDQVQFGELTLARSEDGFALVDLADDEEMRAEEARSLAELAIAPPYNEVRVGAGAVDFTAPDIEIRVTMKEGAERTYAIVGEREPSESAGDAALADASDEADGAGAGGEETDAAPTAPTRYLIKSSDHDQFFTVARYRIERLLSAERASVATPKAPAAAEQTPAPTVNALPADALPADALSADGLPAGAPTVDASAPAATPVNTAPAPASAPPSYEGAVAVDADTAAPAAGEDADNALADAAADEAAPETPLN